MSVYSFPNYNPYGCYNGWNQYSQFYNFQPYQNCANFFPFQVSAAPTYQNWFSSSPFQFSSAATSLNTQTTQNTQVSNDSVKVPFQASPKTQPQKEESKGLSTGAKWAIGIGVAALVAGGIYLLTKGRVSLNDSSAAKNYSENIKKLVLPENINPQQFNTKEEAINFAKNTLQIKNVDEKMTLEALNDSINSIIKVSNKNKGQLFMPPELSFVQAQDDFIASVVANSSSPELGVLKINSSLYDVTEIDNLLMSEKWNKYLFSQDGLPLFDYKNGKLMNNPTFNNIAMKPDSKLSDLLQKYYKKENMTLKEKQNLILSLRDMLDSASKVEKSPVAILEKIQQQYSDFLLQKGIKIDINAFTKKDISEQSKEVADLLGSLIKDKKYLNLDCSVKTIEESIFHEFGHLQDIGINKNLISDNEWYMNRFTTREYYKDTLLPKYPNLKLPTFLTDPVEQNTAGKVSNYATESVGEFIAETYAKMVNGENLPDDVIALYKKYNGPVLNC